MLGRLLVVVLIAGSAVSACSGGGGGGGGGGGDQSPSIGRIDGPAVVDPSYDPFATVVSTPPDTDGG